MKKNIIALFVASLGITLSFGVSAQDKNITETNVPVVNQSEKKSKHIIRVSHVVKATTPKGQAAEAFKNYLEAAFPGRVEVKVYHDNKLFKDREEVEALNLGAVDIIIPTTAKVVSAYNAKDFELLDLPYLFNSQEEVDKFVKSSTAKKMMENLEGSHSKIQPLGLWPNGFRHMIGQNEFKKKSDFAKNNIRVESNSETLKDMHTAFSTRKTVRLGFGDIYESLEGKGRFPVQATDNVLANIYNSKFYEVADVLTLTGHSYMFYTVLANKRWFNSLPQDIQEGIKKVALEAGAVNIKLANQEEENMLKDMASKNTKIVELNKEEKNEMKSWMKPVHENFAKRINQDLLNETYNTIK